MAPAGVYPELEDELERRYDLKDAVIADCAVDDAGSSPARRRQRRGDVPGDDARERRDRRHLVLERDARAHGRLDAAAAARRGRSRRADPRRHRQPDRRGARHSADRAACVAREGRAALPLGAGGDRIAGGNPRLSRRAARPADGGLLRPARLRSSESGRFTRRGCSARAGTSSRRRSSASSSNSARSAMSACAFSTGTAARWEAVSTRASSASHSTGSAAFRARSALRGRTRSSTRSAERSKAD